MKSRSPTEGCLMEVTRGYTRSDGSFSGALSRDWVRGGGVSERIVGVAALEGRRRTSALSGATLSVDW